MRCRNDEQSQATTIVQTDLSGSDLDVGRTEIIQRRRSNLDSDEMPYEPSPLPTIQTRPLIMSWEADRREAGARSWLPAGSSRDRLSPGAAEPKHRDAV